MLMPHQIRLRRVYSHFDSTFVLNKLAELEDVFQQTMADQSDDNFMCFEALNLDSELCRLATAATAGFVAAPSSYGWRETS